MPGLRYEYNTPPVDAFDRANIYDPCYANARAGGHEWRSAQRFHADKNNFAPRVGFAWTIGEDQATVVRGGYGVYYDQSALAPGEALYFNAPYFDFNLFFPFPGLPLTSNDPFPAFFPFPLPDSALAIQRDLRTGYMQHWSVSVQQQLGRSRVLEVAYVGSKGTKLLSARDINQPQPSVLPPGLPFVPRPNPFFDDITSSSRARIRVTTLAGAFSTAACDVVCRRSVLTPGRNRGRCVQFFQQRRRSKLSAGQFQRRRRARAFELRRSASIRVELYLRPAVWKRRRYLHDDGWVSTLLSGWQTFGIVTVAIGTAVHRRAASGDRQQRHRAIGAWLWRERSAKCRR